MTTNDTNKREKRNQYYYYFCILTEETAKKSYMKKILTLYSTKRNQLMCARKSGFASKMVMNGILLKLLFRKKKKIVELGKKRKVSSFSKRIFMCLEDCDGFERLLI